MRLDTSAQPHKTLPCIMKRDGVRLYVNPYAKTIATAYVVGFK